MRFYAPNPFSWHKVFAWWPRHCASNDCIVWLEWVERRRVMSVHGPAEHKGMPEGRFTYWEYRIPPLARSS